MSDTRGQAPARRDGAAQRPARPRPDALGRRRARRRRRDRHRLRPQAAGARRRRRARRARRGPARRGVRRDPARQARRCPQARLPFEYARRSSASPPAPSLAGALLRRRVRGASGEAAAAMLSLAPAVLALRGGELAAYHGVEHKAIAAYEAERGRAPTPPRSTTAAARTSSRRCWPPTSPARCCCAACSSGPGPVAGAGVARRVDRRGSRGVRVVRAQRRHAARARPAPSGLRAPAPDRHARARRAPARGRPRGARGDPARRDSAVRLGFQHPSTGSQTAGRFDPAWCHTVQRCASTRTDAMPSRYAGDRRPQRSVPGPSVWNRVEADVITWAPIIFMALICLRPLADAEADAADEAAADQAGRQVVGRLGATSPAPTRPRPSCTRSSSSCATPSASTRSAPRVPKGILLHGPPGHRQDAARQGRRERVRRRVLLAVGRRVRRDVRRPRRRPHPAPVRRGAQAPARRSSSSTRSTPSAASAARTTTPSASRRSTSCSSRWTASTRPATSS